MEAILNWFNEQWLLTAILVFYVPIGLATLAYCLWDDKRLRRENSRYE